MAKNTPKQKMEKVEVDKHKVWLILAIGIAVVAIAFLLLYSPARVGVFGKAVSVGTSSSIQEGMTYSSKYEISRITINSSAAVGGKYTLSFSSGRFGSVTASLKASNGNKISEMKYNQNDSASRAKPFILRLNYFDLYISGPTSGGSVNVSLLPQWLDNKTITLQEVLPACVTNCTGKVCGDDGCGGTCGSCNNGLSCNLKNGTCINYTFFCPKCDSTLTNHTSYLGGYAKDCCNSVKGCIWILATRVQGKCISQINNSEQGPAEGCSVYSGTILFAPSENNNIKNNARRLACASPCQYKEGKEDTSLGDVCSYCGSNGILNQSGLCMCPNGYYNNDGDWSNGCESDKDITTTTCAVGYELLESACILSGDFNNDTVVNESDFSDLTKITVKINSLMSNLQELNQYLWVVYHNFQSTSRGAK